jgi:Holliday junction DNA helicase RuvA
VYHHFRGQLCDLTPTTAVVEAGGIGFDLRIPVSTYEQLKGKKDVCLFTHLHVREDDLRLFGFATTSERDLFRLLISVNGVGPAIAIQALSASSPREVAEAIASEDLKAIQKIKGVGKKLAERLVVELRDKLHAILAGLGASTGHASQRQRLPARDPALALPEVEDAVLALAGLGFDRKSAEEIVLAKRSGLESSGRPISAESLIKECLRSS